ncbi:hypothetical protein J1N35_014982 [Gossypium stocksii]|uniref:Syntaxin N-terminal domain-containing protein n=1 Tax=Gossypium stocksii TaxID=47602 RepID=A0A9D4AA99_9ROSI|nr:hypothetical protein J1N35_014982 [Gossypium stocksii]
MASLYHYQASYKDCHRLECPVSSPMGCLHDVWWVDQASISKAKQGDPSKLPKWNYDCSSTGQAPGEDSEVILYPQAIFKDPFRRGNNILDAHEESKAVTKAPAMKSIKQQMEKDVDEVGKISRFVKGKIDELDRENLANR